MSVQQRKNYEAAQKKELFSSLFVGTMVSVISFDSSKMTVDVQPLLKTFTPDGYIDPSPILSVPVGCQVGGGVISRPEYQGGDLGFVLFMDGDYSNTILTGQSSLPPTERIHSDSDAIFVGGLVRWSETLQVPAGGYAVSTLDGAASFLLSSSGIKIVGDTSLKGEISIEGNLSVSGTVTASNI